MSEPSFARPDATLAERMRRRAATVIRIEEGLTPIQACWVLECICARIQEHQVAFGDVDQAWAAGDTVRYWNPQAPGMHNKVWIVAHYAKVNMCKSYAGLVDLGPLYTLVDPSTRPDRVTSGILAPPGLLREP